MPLYEYRCGACGEVFSKIAKLDDIFAACSCGNAAQRASFYRDQNIIADRAIPPDGPYKDEAQRRDLAQQGWGIDDTYDALRKSVVEDSGGQKCLDTTRIPTRGGKK